MIPILVSLVILLLCIVAFLVQRVAILRIRAAKLLQEAEQQRAVVESLHVDNVVLKRDLAAKAELVAYTDGLLDKTKNWLCKSNFAFNI